MLKVVCVRHSLCIPSLGGLAECFVSRKPVMDMSTLLTAWVMNAIFIVGKGSQWKWKWKD